MADTSAWAAALPTCRRSCWACCASSGDISVPSFSARSMALVSVASTSSSALEAADPHSCHNGISATAFLGCLIPPGYGSFCHSFSAFVPAVGSPSGVPTSSCLTSLFIYLPSLLKVVPSCAAGVGLFQLIQASARTSHNPYGYSAASEVGPYLSCALTQNAHHREVDHPTNTTTSQIVNSCN